MAEVFKPVRLGAPWRKGQHGIETIQSLNGGLFIHTEDRRVSRRVQIEANNIRGLGFKVRVVADHVVAQPGWLQPVTLPDSGHGHVGGAELLGQAPGTPMRAAVIGAAPGPLQNSRFQLGRTFGGGASLVPGDQAAQALLSKAPPPPLQIGSAARKVARGLSQAPPARQLQDHPRPARVLRAHAARAHPALEFIAFFPSQIQVIGEHTQKLSSSVAHINVTLH